MIRKLISLVLIPAALFAWITTASVNVSLAACSPSPTGPYPPGVEKCTPSNCAYPEVYPTDDGLLPCPVKSVGGVLSILTIIFNLLFAGMVILGSFTFLYGAFVYMTSEGKGEELRKARKMLIYATIALVVAVFAWGFPRVLIGFFS